MKMGKTSLSIPSIPWPIANTLSGLGGARPMPELGWCDDGQVMLVDRLLSKVKNHDVNPWSIIGANYLCHRH